MERVRPKTHQAKKKLPNAMTHGTFTQVTILPGEDPRAFLKLHLDLIQEWQPSGPTEDDAVLTIAKGIWRKGRLQRFLEGELTIYTLHPEHPAYDEIYALQDFLKALDIAPKEALAGSMDSLSNDMKRRLWEELSQKNFESPSKRIQAIKEYICSERLPELERNRKPAQISYWDSKQIVTPEEFEREVALDERIDATIDRATKRLIHIKAMKQMLAQTAGNRATGSNEERERTMVRSFRVVGEK
jgi:hypothetical protein